MKLKRSNRGFSLVELTIVLSIVGLVIGAIWTAYSSASKRNTTNDAAQLLQTVVHNMVTLYQQNRTLPVPCDSSVVPNMTHNAILADVIPLSARTGNLVNGCQTARHPWSGTFAVFAAAADTFTVSFYDVPREGCVALLLQGTSCSPTEPTCPINVYTANGSVGAIVFDPGPPPSWQNRVTPEIAFGNTLCGANAAPRSGGANSVEFTYRL